MMKFNTDYVWHFMNILGMIYCSFRCFLVIGKMRYSPLYCIVRMLYKDYDYMGWLWARKHLIRTILLALIIPYICIVYTAQLDVGLPHIRPIWISIIGGPMWYLIGKNTGDKNLKYDDKI